ncbi:MAG TPA: phosphoribosylformylglycinamidine synthase I [Dehalococcoidales bacterium]|nr:phosphoribosylformylglycinamidine synthase I [Dehalococcoidales bacterium]
MAKVKALVIRAPGTNCDGEAVFAFELAGAVAERVHVNQLVRKEVKLSDYHILVVPGGFSYGDDIASGKVFANEISLKLGEQVNKFVDDGRLILGICNGFQILMKAGLLPRLKKGEPQRVTLTNNDSGKFECRWVYLKVNSKSPCIFTKGMEGMYIPVAHGEGKVTGDMAAISTKNEVVYYVDDNGNDNPGYPWNPNGSERDIAGICDDSGRIFALMPHPERHVLGTQHPQWTRNGVKKYGDGFPIFQNAVKYARSI